MRIIAGEFRSRKLLAPPGLGTRPMPDRVRESIFGMLGTRVRDAQVVDLFAGSGGMGLEALSRGAAGALFVEKDRRAGDFLQRNIDALRCQDRARLIIGDALGAALPARCPSPIDLVFVDPPYPLVRQPLGWDRVRDQCARLIQLLAPDGFLVLRTPCPFVLEPDEHSHAQPDTQPEDNDAEAHAARSPRPPRHPRKGGKPDRRDRGDRSERGSGRHRHDDHDAGGEWVYRIDRPDPRDKPARTPRTPRPPHTPNGPGDARHSLDPHPPHAPRGRGEDTGDAEDFDDLDDGIIIEDLPDEHDPAVRVAGDATAPAHIPADLTIPGAKGPETHPYGTTMVHWYMRRPTDEPASPPPGPLQFPNPS
jgi:16S rRNA (guanine966-N2)-methyltransferase